MTAFVREWYRLDPEKHAVREGQDAAQQFNTTHPSVAFCRFTFLGIERREPWLCIEGWLTQPDDQGPAPTDADIPMGFV